MAMEGVNLLGANQWQAFQLQEAAHNLSQPASPVPAGDQGQNFQALPQNLPSAPVQTARAAHMDPIPDRLDLSLGDSTRQQGRHATPHRDGEAEEEDEDTSEDETISDAEPFGSLAQAYQQLAALPAGNLAAAARLLELSLGERQNLSQLLPSGKGAARKLAEQSLLLASPVVFLVRALRRCADLMRVNADDENLFKLLAVLQAAVTSSRVLAPFLSLSMQSCLDADPGLPDFLETLAENIAFTPAG